MLAVAESWDNGKPIRETLNADILILPGRNQPGGRFPSFTDWVLQVVPCSLWIVHEGPAWKV